MPSKASLVAVGPGMARTKPLSEVKVAPRNLRGLSEKFRSCV